MEAHDGKPASVRGTEGGDEAGVLRIDFPGGAVEQKADGSDSTFFELVRQ